MRHLHFHGIVEWNGVPVSLVGILAIAAINAAAIMLVLVAWKGVGVKDVWRPGAHPARSRDEALSELDHVKALDTDEYNAPCATTLLEPDGDALATIVVFHGFTNCPNQFLLTADELRDRGYRVLVPRQPRHGLKDVLNHSLAGLTPEELTTHVDQVVDIAAGFGDTVYAIGLSGGGNLAYWAAATRDDIERVAAAAPFAAPTGMPVWATRLLVALRPAVPKAYWWWDPRKKADLGESPYVYPGFPLPGMLPYLHLAILLGDKRVKPAHDVPFVSLVTNPGDFAIRVSAARRLFRNTFAGSSTSMAEYAIAEDLKWWHDFVDPNGSHHGTPTQVADVFLAALGVSQRGLDEGLVATDGPSAA